MALISCIYGVDALNLYESTTVITERTSEGFRVPFAKEGGLDAHCRRVTPQEADPANQHFCFACGSNLRLREGKRTRRHFVHPHEENTCNRESVLHKIAIERLLEILTAVNQGTLRLSMRIPRGSITGRSRLIAVSPGDVVTAPFRDQSRNLIYDVALTVNGLLATAFEVRHKHAVGTIKRDIMPWPWFEVEARRLMGQDIGKALALASPTSPSELILPTCRAHLPSHRDPAIEAIYHHRSVIIAIDQSIKHAQAQLDEVPSLVFQGEPCSQHLGVRREIAFAEAWDAVRLGRGGSSDWHITLLRQGNPVLGIRFVEASSQRAPGSDGLAAAVERFPYALVPIPFAAGSGATPTRSLTFPTNAHTLQGDGVCSVCKREAIERAQKSERDLHHQEFLQEAESAISRSCAAAISEHDDDGVDLLANLTSQLRDSAKSHRQSGSWALTPAMESQVRTLEGLVKKRDRRVDQFRRSCDSRFEICERRVLNAAKIAQVNEVESEETAELSSLATEQMTDSMRRWLRNSIQRVHAACQERRLYLASAQYQIATASSRIDSLRYAVSTLIDLEQTVTAELRRLGGLPDITDELRLRLVDVILNARAGQREQAQQICETVRSQIWEVRRRLASHEMATGQDLAKAVLAAWKVVFTRTWWPDGAFPNQIRTEMNDFRRTLRARRDERASTAFARGMIAIRSRLEQVNDLAQFQTKFTQIVETVTEALATNYRRHATNPIAQVRAALPSLLAEQLLRLHRLHVAPQAWSAWRRLQKAAEVQRHSSGRQLHPSELEAIGDLQVSLQGVPVDHLPPIIAEFLFHFAQLGTSHTARVREGILRVRPPDLPTSDPPAIPRQQSLF